MGQLRRGGFLVSQVHQLSGRVFATMLKARHIAINPAQGRILFALWEQDDVPVGHLARRTALTASTLTRMLDRLEATGHVIRLNPEGDRRTVLVRLAEGHLRTKAAYDEVSAAMTELFYRGFTDEEIDTFERSLSRVLANLTTAEQAGNQQMKEMTP